MTWSESLHIRSDLAELSRLGSWVSFWAEQHCVPEEMAQQVDLCATEAVTNVMTHGVSGSDSGEIQLRVSRVGNDVVLEIEDDGIAFDPTQAPLPPPVTMDSEGVGGWGMRIVRSLSDEVRYQRVAGRNRLTLVFRPRPSVSA
jgi:anti-sigma regulatory factor (Ser/Thr protein kinase)